MTSKSDSALAFLHTNPISSGVSDIIRSFTDRRDKLGLSNPGTIENLSRELQRDVLLSNYMFTGIRADLIKAFSLSPLFQVSHQFAIGERMSPYTLAALYGSSKVSFFFFFFSFLLPPSPNYPYNYKRSCFSLIMLSPNSFSLMPSFID